MDSVAGWYGKLPSLGDFASRRLPADFVETWDEWLASGLAQWRDADDGWLQAYLAAPPWCFVLGPGLLGARRGLPVAGPAWAGVLMPSVDRVGRYFPLTIASPLPTLGANDALRLASWLREACTRAVDALHEDWDPDELDEALFDLTDLTRPMPAPGDDQADLRRALEHLSRHRDDALWWQPTANGVRALHHTTGLPSGAAFTRLFGVPRRRVPPAADDPS
jgi:type VI secretion system protein ImpM